MCVFLGEIFRNNLVDFWCTLLQFYYIVEVQMWSQSDQSTHSDHSSIHIINIYFTLGGTSAANGKNGDAVALSAL